MILEPVGDRLFAFGLLNRRQHSRHTHRQAGRAHLVNGGELRVGQLRGAQRERRLFGFVESLFKQGRAALDGGRGIIQFVRQSSGQPAERRHFLVLQIVRREDAAPVEHLVHEQRRELGDTRESSRSGLRGGLREPPWAPGRPSHPADVVSREYGSMPVTSPARHSITL